MFKTKEGAVIILNKITSLGRIQFDEGNEYRKANMGNDTVTIYGDDCLRIELALNASLGGAIWKWE